jgi:thiol-disulfide isomerase/thioredoxin
VVVVHVVLVDVKRVLVKSISSIRNIKYKIQSTKERTSCYYCYNLSIMKKILLTIFTTLFLVSCGSTNTSYPNLTACLEKNQVVMFGASWCPHCAAQKKLFGKSAKDMPYFECAL